MSATLADISTLTTKLANGDRAALARLLTLASSDHDSAPMTTALRDVHQNNVPVVAFTGSGGVGKSSLLGAVTSRFAARGERVAVLACDPESPITGGALLGDRCRIAGIDHSDRVFIRSVSTGTGEQGVARNIRVMIELLRAYPFERIFVETVGAGQTDTSVRSIAEKVVLVLQPQTGDSLQWEKAGILEIADIVVVNKSDLPGADLTVAELSEQLHAADGADIPILKTSIAKGEGVEALCRAIESAVADAYARKN